MTYFSTATSQIDSGRRASEVFADALHRATLLMLLRCTMSAPILSDVDVKDSALQFDYCCLHASYFTSGVRLILCCCYSCVQLRLVLQNTVKAFSVFLGYLLINWTCPRIPRCLLLMIHACWCCPQQRKVPPLCTGAQPVIRTQNHVSAGLQLTSHASIGVTASAVSGSGAPPCCWPSA
jgi:hypothetical protein